MMEFEIAEASQDDIVSAAVIIRRAWETMENRDWFVADDADYIREAVETGCGMVFKAVERKTGKMAGILCVVFPGDSKKNLGLDAGLSYEECRRTAHVDSIAVLPEFRGNGLQSKLMQAAEDALCGTQYRHLCCTVHPDNRFSRDNMVGLGYRQVKRAEKYGGLLRDIMMKEIPESSESSI